VKPTLAFGFLCLFLILSGCQSGSVSQRRPASSPPSSASKPVPEQKWRDEAQRWLGTPYRLGGNNRSGIDCSGFSLAMYQNVAGVSLPRTTKQQFSTGVSVSDRQLRAGDLVFFQTTSEPVSHVGVWMGNNSFVHASTSKGVIISSLTESYYSKRFVGARRVVK